LVARSFLLSPGLPLEVLLLGFQCLEVLLQLYLLGILKRLNQGCDSFFTNPKEDSLVAVHSFSSARWRRIICRGGNLFSKPGWAELLDSEGFHQRGEGRHSAQRNLFENEWLRIAY